MHTAHNIAINSNVSFPDTSYCRPHKGQVAAVYRLNTNGSLSDRQLHPAGLPVHSGRTDRVRIRSVHRSVPHQKEPPPAGGQIGPVAPCKWSWLDKPALLHQKKGPARSHDQRSGHFWRKQIQAVPKSMPADCTYTSVSAAFKQHDVMSILTDIRGIAYCPVVLKSS